MSDASRELIQAVFRTLLGDQSLSDILGGSKVFDHIPDHSALPYIVLGSTTKSDWSTATEDGASVDFMLHIWSATQGRSLMLQIQSDIETLLQPDRVTVQGHQLIQLRNPFSETRRDIVSGHLHGLMRFHALIEPDS